MKSAARFAGKDLDAMKAVARAQTERSLEMFKSTLQDYQDRELQIVVDRLITRLQSFTRTPSSGPISQRCTTRSWSRTSSVSLSRTRRLSCRGLPTKLVKDVTSSRKSKRTSRLSQAYLCVLLRLTARLSQMILDQVFFGVLNEKAGTLEVFGEMQSEVSPTGMCAMHELTCVGPAQWSIRHDEADGERYPSALREGKVSLDCF